MSTRRKRTTSLEAFGDQGGDLAAVDGVLFGDFQRADRDKVIVRPIDPKNVVVDPDIQPRVSRLNEERVVMLLNVLLGGGDFADPIETCRLEDDERELLAHGEHRLEAYRRAQKHPKVTSKDVVLPPLRSRSHPGGKAAALTLAEDGNLDNGEPLTNADKKNILWRRLDPTRQHPWQKQSVRDIAARLGVSHPTITAWMEEYYETTGKNLPVRERHGKEIVTKSGQIMQTGAIKKANQKRAKAGPTTTQIKRGVIKHLRAATDGLCDLNDQGAEELRRYAEQLAQEWGIK